MGNCELACNKCSDILKGEHEYDDNNPTLNTKPIMPGQKGQYVVFNKKYNDYHKYMREVIII